MLGSEYLGKIIQCAMLFGTTGTTGEPVMSKSAAARLRIKHGSYPRVEGEHWSS